MCVVPTVTFERLFAFLVMDHGWRQLLWVEVTSHPTAEWTAQQLLQAFPWDTAPRFLLRDRDGNYGKIFRESATGLGIEEVLCAPHSPWQNAYAERLIGSIRRECLDHVIVLHERGLRRVLRSYFKYYNYASYCPPRYVVENSKPFCCDVGITVCRLPRRTRSTNLAVASVSNAR